MNDVPLPRIIFSLLVFTVMFFTGCSESEPALDSVKGYAVFDYKDESQNPSVRLAVFAQVSSEVRRAENIRIKNVSTGFEWNCINPSVFSDDKNQWVGYADFLSPDGIDLPIGIYNFAYTDSQEKEVNLSFSLNYDSDLIKANAEKSISLLGENPKEKYAIYSEANVLLYYGEKKQNWINDEKIFSTDVKYSYYRKIYTDRYDGVVCIMPPVYKNTKNN